MCCLSQSFSRVHCQDLRFQCSSTGSQELPLKVTAVYQCKSWGSPLMCLLELIIGPIRAHWQTMENSQNEYQFATKFSELILWFTDQASSAWSFLIWFRIYPAHWIHWATEEQLVDLPFQGPWTLESLLLLWGWSTQNWEPFGTFGE